MSTTSAETRGTRILFYIMAGYALLAPIVSFGSLRSLGTLPVLSAVLATAVLWFSRRSLPPLDWHLAAVLAVLLAYCGLSATWSPDALFGLERTGKILMLFVCALLLLALVHDALEPRQRDLLAWLFLCAVLAGPFLIMLEVATDGMIFNFYNPQDDPQEWKLFYLNRPIVALSLLVWPAAVLLERSRGKAPALMLMGLVAVAALVSASQSAQLAILVSVTAWALAQLWPVAALSLVTGGSACLALSLPWLAPVLYRWLAGSALLAWDPDSLSGRLEIWDAVAERTLERPLFGAGLEATRFVENFDSIELYVTSSIIHPHNGALQLWFEEGLLGVLLWLSVVLFVAWRVARLERQMRAAAIAALAGALTVIFVSHGLWQSWWIGLLATTAAMFVMMRGLPLRRSN